jgi:hypothetical protein
MCTVRSLPGLAVIIFVLYIGLTSFISPSGPGHFIVILVYQMSNLLIFIIPMYAKSDSLTDWPSWSYIFYFSVNWPCVISVLVSLWKTWPFWSLNSWLSITSQISLVKRLTCMVFFDLVSIVAGQSPGLIFPIFKFCLVKRTIWSFLSFSLLIGQLTVQSFAFSSWLVTNWPCHC